MKVSVVIVCMNRPDNLYPCLKSMMSYTKLQLEILVVAYLFDKESLLKARNDFPDVIFIENDRISGFSENNNLALRQATGDYCFVLNDDTEFIAPVIDTLVEDMGKLPEECAIVSPRILNSDDTLQLCGRPHFSACQYVLEKFHLYKEHLDDTVGKTPVTGSIYETSNICGAAFLIKTDIFREMGWFDERFFFTPEDFALSTMAREKGYKVYVDSGVDIRHKWHATASKIVVATHPSGMRGTIMFFSRGSNLRYLMVGIPVFIAESTKAVKALFSSLISPDEKKTIELMSYFNNLRSIFTHKSTKEIFIRFLQVH